MHANLTIGFIAGKVAYLKFAIIHKYNCAIRSAANVINIIECAWVGLSY